MIETTATVLGNHCEYADYWRLSLRLPVLYVVLPGQFAMVRPHGELEPILRRPMVYYRVRPGEAEMEVEFIYRVIGRGTSQLARVRPGDRVDILGPLGNGYQIDGGMARGQHVALVSGGVGIPGLYLLAKELRARGIQARLFHGDRTSDPERGLVCLPDFRELLGDEAVAGVTEDGSYGASGYATDPLAATLRTGSNRPAVIYACGPRPMLGRVAELAQAFNVPAQVSLEARMACGFGVCLACAERVIVDGQEIYVRVCIKGPVFHAEEVVWD